MDGIQLNNHIKETPQTSKFMWKLYFLCCLIGTRGSGKTINALKIMKELINEKVLFNNNIFIVSPTYHENPMLMDLMVPEENIKLECEQVGEVINVIIERSKETNELRNDAKEMGHKKIQ